METATADTITFLHPLIGEQAPQLLAEGQTERATFWIEQLLIAEAAAGNRLTCHEQGALFLLAGFNNGRLLTHWMVRRSLHEMPIGLGVHWPLLHNLAMTGTAYDWPGLPVPQDGLPLGRHSRDAILIANALSNGPLIEGLGASLAGFDGWNKWVAYCAFGIALDQLDLICPSVQRRERETRLRAEAEAFAKVTTGIEEVTRQDVALFEQAIDRKRARREY